MGPHVSKPHDRVGAVGPPFGHGCHGFRSRHVPQRGNSFPLRAKEAPIVLLLGGAEPLLVAGKGKYEKRRMV